MHLYWASERVTEEEIAKRSSDATQGSVQFNVGIKTVAAPEVADAPWGNVTADAEIPVMGNTKQFKKASALCTQRWRMRPRMKGQSVGRAKRGGGNTTAKNGGESWRQI